MSGPSVSLATAASAPGAPITRLSAGRALLIVLPRSASLHVGLDGWQDIQDLSTRPLGLDLHGLSLTASQLQGRHGLDFTWQWQEGAWLGEDFHIDLVN